MRYELHPATFTSEESARTWFGHAERVRRPDAPKIHAKFDRRPKPPKDGRPDERPWRILIATETAASSTEPADNPKEGTPA